MGPGLSLGDVNTALIIWLPLLLLWIFTLIDLFRNKGISGLAKGLWAVFIIWFPIVGALVYFAVRGRYADEEASQERYESYTEQGLRASRERGYDVPR